MPESRRNFIRRAVASIVAAPALPALAEAAAAVPTGTAVCAWRSGHLAAWSFYPYALSDAELDRIFERMSAVYLRYTVDYANEAWGKGEAWGEGVAWADSPWAEPMADE